MQTLLRTIATVTWGLWFGGMMALLIFVIRLFGESRETGIIAAPVLFRAFATYQLIVGTIALLAAALLAYLSRSRVMFIATAFLALAWVAALPTWSITHRIDAMRQNDQTQTEDFRRLHHRSELIYSGSAICVLLAGLMLPVARPKSAS
jgi:hypothetical protein